MPSRPPYLTSAGPTADPRARRRSGPDRRPDNAPTVRRPSTRSRRAGT